MKGCKHNNGGILTIVVIIIVIILILFCVSKRFDLERRDYSRHLTRSGRHLSNNFRPEVMSSNCAKKAPCYNTYCAKELECFNRVFSSVFPQEISYSISYPGAINSEKVPNIESYLNTLISSESSRTPNLITKMNPTGIYSCWCFDTNDFITPGTQYVAEVISLLDPSIDAAINAAYTCNPTKPIYTTYLGGILYIFNEAQNYQALGYSYEDIQVSIWTLLFTSNPLTATPDSDGGNLSYTAANVAAIIKAAVAAQLAYNADGDACTHLITTKIMGLVCFNNNPITSSTGCNQILCLQVPMYEVDICYRNCSACN